MSGELEQAKARAAELAALIEQFAAELERHGFDSAARYLRKHGHVTTPKELSS